MLVLALSAFAVSKNYAQEVVVGARLYNHPPEVRPMRPSRGHIWVAGEWTPSGGTYVWHAGYWALPPHPGGVRDDPPGPGRPRRRRGPDLHRVDDPGTRGRAGRRRPGS